MVEERKGEEEGEGEGERERMTKRSPISRYEDGASYMGDDITLST